MRSRAALLLLVLSTNAAALTVTVQSSGHPIAAADVRARLRRVDAEEAARQISLAIGATTELPLPEGTWEITAASDAAWAAPVYASASDAVMLEVWPRAEILGSVGNGAPATGELLLQFSPGDPESDAPSGVSTCTMAERQWRCAVPAGSFDLRLALAGFATEFRWGVEVAPGAALDLKRVDFVPGSSLIGYVEAARAVAAIDLRYAEVLVATAAGGPAPRRVRTFAAKPNARGFFQIKGLAPGEYTVRATAKELVSDVRTVQIAGHTNATLKEPLVVAKPATLTVTAMPRLDPDNQPWQIELARRRDGARWLHIVESSRASAEGVWARKGVTPGEYIVSVQRRDGSVWKSEPVTVAAEDASLHVLLLGERVAGTVALGDRPLAATLRFGGERGPALIASDDGRFSGVVAPLGDGPALIQVTAEAANIRRTLKLEGRLNAEGVRHFEVQLPSTVVSGVVRNEDGSPEAGAIVTLDSPDGEEFEQTHSEEDGTFQMVGLEPGTYRLGAQAFASRSDLVAVTLDDAPSEPVELVLRAELAIRGQVRMGAVPVAGAYVLAIPRGVRIQTGPQATSDAAGRFALQLPPSTATYDIAVIPRGFYMSIGRVTADPGRILRAEIAQDGGALRVDAPAGEYLRLLHAGAEFPLELLARRSEGTVELSGERQRLGIANLEPGMYSVCGTKACASAWVPRFGSASISLR